MIYIISFCVLITTIVFVHEYGHYYFAKKYGVKVEEFFIVGLPFFGLNKPLFSLQDKYGTKWSIGFIPLGGYVKFFSDDVYLTKEEILNKFSKEESDKVIQTKPFYQKFLICAGGPLSNYMFAILIFAMLNMFVGKDFTPAIIDEVMDDSPAFVSGFKKNDRIIYINNKKVESILQISTFINTSSTENIEIIVLRNNQEISLMVTPNIVESKNRLGILEKRKIIGIKLSAHGQQQHKLGPAKALNDAVDEVWFVTVLSFKTFVKLISGSGDTSQLVGPIGIAQISGTVAEHGIISFIHLMAYISIALGFINLFPILPFDGGFIAIYLYEKISGRSLKKETLSGLMRIGLFFVFFLIFLVTFNDLARLG